MISSLNSPKTKNELISDLQKSQITKFSVKEVLSGNDLASVHRDVRTFLGTDKQMTLLMIKTK